MESGVHRFDLSFQIPSVWRFRNRELNAWVVFLSLECAGDSSGAVENLASDVRADHSDQGLTREGRNEMRHGHEPHETGHFFPCPGHGCVCRCMSPDVRDGTTSGLSVNCERSRAEATVSMKADRVATI
jgi:hypothetical protein